MIIRLNGTFGVGKTTTARGVVGHLPVARIFDPEEVGCMLAHVMVHEPVDDFQDWPLWRALVVKNAAEIIAYTKGTLVVPMTVLSQGYAHEIFSGLTAESIPFVHVLLHAEEAELRRRIAESDEHPGNPAASEKNRKWRYSKLDSYVDAVGWLAASAHVVDTTSSTPEQVIQDVLAIVKGVSS